MTDAAAAPAADGLPEAEREARPARRSRTVRRMTARRGRAGEATVPIRRRRMLLAVVVVALSLAVLPDAGPGRTGTAAAALLQTSRPALQFSQTEFFVYPEQRVLPVDTTQSRRGEHSNENLGTAHFGQVEVLQTASTPAALEYAVEAQPDAPSITVCVNVGEGRAFSYSSSHCEGVHIGILPDEDSPAPAGRLYFYSPEDDGESAAIKYRIYHSPAEMTPQRVELSALDPLSNRKIYREVVVSRSPRIPDCSEYPAMDANRYVCLNQVQLLPDDPPATPQAWTAALPTDLFQARENYRLVFAEEFAGTPAAANTAGCRDGMGLVDPDAFNYWLDPCGSVDSRGVPCQNVVGGVLYAAKTSTCGSTMNSRGKLKFRYGYFEYRYTVHLVSTRGRYMNAALILGNSRPSQKVWVQPYGITLDGYDDLTKYTTIEMDVTEFTNRFDDHYNRYLNWPRTFSNSANPARLVSRRTSLCGYPNPLYVGMLVFRDSAGGCTTAQRATVTEGFEWSPRGYRSFTKVEGATLYQRCRQKISETVLPNTACSIRDLASVTVPADGFVVGDAKGLTQLVRGSGSWDDVPFSQRSDILEYETKTETDSLGNTSTRQVLTEQFAVSHIPNHLGLSTWGFTVPPEITLRMDYHYFRVYQPTNHYSDMEPHFG